MKGFGSIEEQLERMLMASGSYRHCVCGGFQRRIRYVYAPTHASCERAACSEGALHALYLFV